MTLVSVAQECQVGGKPITPVAQGGTLSKNVSTSGCVDAGFSTCCVPSANQSCVINSGQVDECSCDVGCFENDTCCFDITEVPCLPGETMH